MREWNSDDARALELSDGSLEIVIAIGFSKNRTLVLALRPSRAGEAPLDVALGSSLGDEESAR